MVIVYFNILIKTDLSTIHKQIQHTTYNTNHTHRHSASLTSLFYSYFMLGYNTPIMNLSCWSEHVFIDQMPFMMPNEQYQSTDRNNQPYILHKFIRGVYIVHFFQLCIVDLLLFIYNNRCYFFVAGTKISSCQQHRKLFQTVWLEFLKKKVIICDCMLHRHLLCVLKTLNIWS